MRTAICATVAALFALANIGLAQADSGIEGVITVGAIHGGPARDGVPHTRPLAGVTFAVTSDKGHVTSFTTDEQGHFRVQLPAGQYTVKRADPIETGSYGPFDVEVGSGKFTTVAWNCDDGRM